MNENQKTCLEYLKSVYNAEYPFEAITSLVLDFDECLLGINISSAIDGLSEKEKYEILIEFGKWGLKNE